MNKKLRPLSYIENGWESNDIPDDIPELELRYKDGVIPSICKSGNIIHAEYDKSMIDKLISDLLYIDDIIMSSWDASWVSQRDKLNDGYKNYVYPNGHSKRSLFRIFTDDNILINSVDVPEKYKFINNIIDRNYCKDNGHFECLKQLNLFSWDLSSVDWLKSKIYNNLKEWFPDIDEESYVLGWFNITKNNHKLVWHNHYDKVGLKNIESKNIPLSSNIILYPPKLTSTWTEFYDPEIGRWKIPSQLGNMMAFDSRILHVPGNIDKMKDDEFRISISMDIINPNKLQTHLKSWQKTNMDFNKETENLLENTQNSKHIKLKDFKKT